VIHRILERRAHRPLLDTNACPVGIELFGDEHRDGGVHTLSHFGYPDDDGDAIVGANAQIRTRPEFGRSRGVCEALRTRQRENDD
jgi:hypothetical protein